MLNGVDPGGAAALRGGFGAAAPHPGARLLGAVSRDDAFAAALARRALVQDTAPDSRAASDLREVARALLARLPAAAAPSLAAAAELLSPRPRVADRPCLAAAAALLAGPAADASGGSCTCGAASSSAPIRCFRSSSSSSAGSRRSGATGST